MPSFVAVIDFEHMGVGDPACDLLVAWTLLGPAQRQLLRDELEVDDATWLRGRGWAVEFGARALVYSAPSAPLWRTGHTALIEIMAERSSCHGGSRPSAAREVSTSFGLESDLREGRSPRQPKTLDSGAAPERWPGCSLARLTKSTNWAGSNV